MPKPSFVEHRLNAAPPCRKSGIVTTGVLVRIDMSGCRKCYPAVNREAQWPSRSLGTATAIATMAALLMPLHVAPNTEVLAAALVLAFVGFLARM